MTSVTDRRPVVIEHSEDETVYSTAGRGDTFQAVLSRRLNRRDALKGAAAAGAIALAGSGLGLRANAMEEGAATDGHLGLTFEAIPSDDGIDHKVASGFVATPLLRWGDPIFPDAPEFDVLNQSAAAQARQIGYNHDWLGFVPLPFGETTSDRGLLCINHEYTNGELMFPGYVTLGPPGEGSEEPTITFNHTQDIVDIELEAHGLSVVEIARNDAGEWDVILDSQYNRRITATTPMELTGPAAGADSVTTNEDPTGTTVLGTLNNCAGGLTPWGTIVTGEENFNQYFANAGVLDTNSPVAQNHSRYGLPEEASERGWELYYDRFDLAKEPNEPMRFGWGVEIDPLDPTSTPKKRTALGRNKHEGHTSVVTPSGQVAIYSGDDQRFDYAYKFVTAGTYDPDNREANLDLLDDGILYVAVYNDDGTGDWLPLVFGEGPLTEENGFTSQADVLVNTRGAADVLGATKMDRPEDFETNPVTGKVYLALTNNSQRAQDERPDVDAANPRAENLYGHIIEMTEADNDHAATTFAWDIFILCGPADDETANYGGFDINLVSTFSAPDNITFDNLGNVWISTDGDRLGNDGMFAVPTEGEERGYSRKFYQVPDGAECSGPEFTPDNSTLFVSVQHPGEGGYFEEPRTTWPDFAPENGVPRPSIVAIQREDDRVAAIVTEARA